MAIYLSLTHPVGHLAHLWRAFRSWQPPDGPTYLDAAAVVFELGIPCNVTLVPSYPTLTFADWDALRLPSATVDYALPVNPHPSRRPRAGCSAPGSTLSPPSSRGAAPGAIA